MSLNLEMSQNLKVVPFLKKSMRQTLLVFVLDKIVSMKERAKITKII